jgi:ribosomal protein S18 acetylase RimI-like enzyme
MESMSDRVRNYEGDYKILQWDSDFFGFTVARILPDRLHRDQLERILAYLKEDHVTLAYWASNPDDDESQQAATLFSGFLADKKVTFVTDLEGVPVVPSLSPLTINEYLESYANAELENLAVRAGNYSRFKEDPKIPECKVVELYTLWIRNSVKKEIADAVFVARLSEKIVGMVTMGEANGRCAIGLIAIDVSMRMRDLGRALICTVHAWAVPKGFRYAQVVTQERNTAAYSLYKKCGYRIDKTEYLYHFWI